MDRPLSAALRQRFRLLGGVPRRSGHEAFPRTINAALIDLDAADYCGIDAWTAPAFGLPTVHEDAPVEWQHRSRLDPGREPGARRLP